MSVRSDSVLMVAVRPLVVLKYLGQEVLATSLFPGEAFFAPNPQDITTHLYVEVVRLKPWGLQPDHDPVVLVVYFGRHQSPVRGKTRKTHLFRFCFSSRLRWLWLSDRRGDCT